ncbi:MAG: hypothetical protein H6R21_1883, partial [Proteobacteria bacterium]|nr:hypothetical protein [Pseudomonadota bacterium]
LQLPDLPAGAVTLNEADSKSLVAAAQVPVTRDRLLPLNPGETVAGLRYPVALKIVSPDITHKTDIGAVQLGIAGLGGVYTEILHDVAYRIAPFGLAEAYAMLEELKGRALLAGARDLPPRDVDALAQALVQVAVLAWTLRGRMQELDINPLLVRPHGQGVIAADALVVLRAENG